MVALQPETDIFLSERSIQRRTQQNIQIDETDLPVSPVYIDSIQQVGNVKILNVSKWLNQVCIETTDSAALSKINSFSFVQGALPVMKPQKNITIQTKFNEKLTPANYLIS